MKHRPLREPKWSWPRLDPATIGFLDIGRGMEDGFGSVAPGECARTRTPCGLDLTGFITVTDTFGSAATGIEAERRAPSPAGDDPSCVWCSPPCGVPAIGVCVWPKNTACNFSAFS